MQRDKDQRVTSTELACTNAHPLGKTASGRLLRLAPRVRPRPYLRFLRSIRVQLLSSRQVPNGSCRFVHGCHGKRRGHHLTHAHGLWGRYGPIG